MKISRILVALGGFQAITGSPIVLGFYDEEISKALKIAGVSVNPAELAIPKLDRRISCAPLNRVVRTIGTSKLTVKYIAATSALARVVCAYAHGSSCGDLSLVIAGSMYIVYLAAADYAGATPVDLPMRRDLLTIDPRDESAHAEYAQYWINVLSNSTATYGSIVPVPLTDDEAASEIAKRAEANSTLPLLVSRVQISDYKFNQTSPAQDLMMLLFDDGTIVSHIPLLDNNSSSLSKRFDRPGFKISYITHSRSQLSKGHMRDMSSALAHTWANLADYYHMDEIMGLASTGHYSNFRYRIISEVRGFGTEYESVNICGHMGTL